MVAAKDTMPRSVAKTGTYATNGKIVTGVGTLMATELHIGDWIYVAAAGEIRQVTSITNNLSATIAQAFTANVVAGTALVVTPKSNFVEISLVIPPALAAGILDNETMYPGVPVNWSKASRDNSAQKDFCDPMILDATGTVILIQGTQ